MCWVLGHSYLCVTSGSTLVAWRAGIKLVTKTTPTGHAWLPHPVPILTKQVVIEVIGQVRLRAVAEGPLRELVEQGPWQIPSEYLCPAEDLPAFSRLGNPE